ncbi:bacteriohemerythrin [Colwellia sp. M166]|uniref:bacteriohemerythrin n=1 Tax=Colwellia sp. M166 TaxID=2583805 RepID=UPI00211DA6A5|nr:bacteriohemerythrin [Colwellia sp. M166]UUO24827.1 bacteriohemerythrin [Colwellia sp. M166]|tara:strand:+ start:18223 stop:18621 length:399 start_codon:yes stop_codon:yes gene_type:complete
MKKKHLITWDTAFEVGIASIDSQHRTLINYINELAYTIDNRKIKTEVSTLFIKLYEYTKFHFKAEEAYFFTLNENDCLLHQLQHKHFIEELDRLIALNENETCSQEQLYLLTDWLLNHIQEEDLKFLQQHKP